MSDILDDKNLEDVNGGYKEETVVTYSFDIGDKFQDSEGFYYVAANKTTTNKYNFVYVIRNNLVTGEVFYSNCTVNTLRNMQFVGNDMEGFEAVKKIAKY